MKPRLIVHNVGPIKEINIEINKVNVFIGPQSIGKSTLAKIISFCAWLEKNILINLGSSHINKDFLHQNLLVYHKLTNFFSELSLIEYTSDFILFKFMSTEDFHIEITGNVNDTYMRKITYIPAERNFVTIPNISTLSLENNYVRDFIFDWLLIHNKFTHNNRLELLGLGGIYSFDTNKGDIITLDDGKEIPLNHASSGLQSVVPLLAFIAYGADWIFHHDPDLSFDTYKSLQKALIKLDGGNPEIKNESLYGPMVIDALRDSTRFANGNLKQLAELVEHISKPHSSFFVIEEPEANLFPFTQYELAKYIIKMLDNGNENTLVVTTHSPYMMTSINNLIQAQNAVDSQKTEKEKLADFLKTDSFVSYSDINAMAFIDGKLVNIKDDEFQLISAASLDAASDKIGADFEMLLNL